MRPWPSRSHKRPLPTSTAAPHDSLLSCRTIESKDSGERGGNGLDQEARPSNHYHHPSSTRSGRKRSLSSTSPSQGHDEDEGRGVESERASANGEGLTNHHLHINDEDMMMFTPEMTDVVAGISLLSSRFHSQGPFRACPLILQHQLYTVLTDATAVDVEIERLRRQNFIRMLRLLTTTGDVGLVLTSTYIARIDAAIDACNNSITPTTTATSTAANPTTPSSLSSSHHHHPAMLSAALLFLKEVLQRYTSVSITSEQLNNMPKKVLQVLPSPPIPPISTTGAAGGRGGGEGKGEKSSIFSHHHVRVPIPSAAGGRGGGGADSVREAKGEKKRGKGKGEEDETEDEGEEERKVKLGAALRQLVTYGFLARRVDARFEEAYWFSAPELGGMTASLPVGRKAILAAIKRSRYKELLERNLKALESKKSQLSIDFHLSDLIGLREVVPVKTAAGLFLRLPVVGGNGGGRGGRR